MDSGDIEWIAFDRTVDADGRSMTVHCLGVRRITINAIPAVQPASSVLKAIECRYHPIRFVEQDARLLIDAVRIDRPPAAQLLVTAPPAAPPAPP